MADVQKTIEIIFGAVDKTAGGIASVGAGISGLASSAQTAIAPINAIADGVKTFDTAVVALGIALGGAALQKAGTFGDSIKQIGVLFDGTSTQVGKFKGDVEAYAAGSTKSLTDITGALNNAIGSGIKWEESIKFVATAETLALGASGSLADATDTLVASMNAYGASTDEAGKYTDTLMQTVLLGKTTLPELNQSLSNVTGTASAAKVPFTDINAAIAAMTAAGAPTSQAVTAINQALIQMINPSKQAKDLAGELGLKFDATALATDGFKGTLDKVYAATGGNITQLTTLFGSVDALKAVAILGADKAGVFAAALDKMKTSSGSAEAAAKTLEAQWSVSMQKLTNATDLTLIAIGDKLNEGGAFSGILSGLSGIFQSIRFSVNAGAFDDVFEFVREVATDLGELLSGVAKALPAALENVDFSKLIEGMGALTGSFGSIFGDLDLTTVEGLTGAIQLVVDTIGNLLTAGSGIVDNWGAAIEAVLPMIQAFADLDVEGAKAVGQALGFADVLNAILPSIGAVGGAVEALGTGLSLLGAAKLGGLAVEIAGVATAAGGLATAGGLMATALGTAGAATAAGAAGYAVGTVLADGIDWVVDKLTGSGSLGGLIYDLTHDTDNLTEAAPKAATAVKSVGTESNKVAQELEKSNQKMIDAAVAAANAEDKAAKLATAQGNASGMVSKAVPVYDAATGALVGYEQKMVKASEAGIKLKENTEKTNTPLKTSGDVMEVLSKKTNLTNDELIKLTKVTKDAEIELEKLASNERIKLIESKVKLDIAQLEAQTKQVEAAFESINNTVNSTGETISSLWGNVKDLSGLDKYRLEDQIEEENRRRDEALALQKELTMAQVEQMRAQAQAMDRGDSLITIQGDGLKPHLEAFMWEILKAIQVRVNQDGLKLLLGA